MNPEESVIIEREQRFRHWYYRISVQGATLADKAEARELLVELEQAQGEGKLSGFENSKMPWFRNYVKHVCK